MSISFTTVQFWTSSLGKGSRETSFVTRRLAPLSLFLVGDILFKRIPPNRSQHLGILITTRCRCPRRVVAFSPDSHPPYAVRDSKRHGFPAEQDPSALHVCTRAAERCANSSVNYWRVNQLRRPPAPHSRAARYPLTLQIHRATRYLRALNPQIHPLQHWTRARYLPRRKLAEAA